MERKGIVKFVVLESFLRNKKYNKRKTQKLKKLSSKLKDSLSTNKIELSNHEKNILINLLEQELKYSFIY